MNERARTSRTLSPDQFVVLLVNRSGFLSFLLLRLWLIIASHLSLQIRELLAELGQELARLRVAVVGERIAPVALEAQDVHRVLGGREWRRARVRPWRVRCELPRAV